MTAQEKIRPVNIRDVAEASGVSVSTVSNVLNFPDRVAERTRERVRSAIQDLGYRRNEAAAALRRGRVRPAPARRAQTIAAFEESDQRANGDPRVGAPDGEHCHEPVDERSGRQLREGQVVSVRRPGGHTEVGVIDIVMPNRSGAWVWLNNGGGRRYHDAGSLEPDGEDQQSPVQ